MNRTHSQSTISTSGNEKNYFYKTCNDFLLVIIKSNNSQVQQQQVDNKTNTAEYSEKTNSNNSQIACKRNK